MTMGPGIEPQHLVGGACSHHCPTPAQLKSFLLLSQGHVIKREGNKVINNKINVLKKL